MFATVIGIIMVIVGVLTIVAGIALITSTMSQPIGEVAPKKKDIKDLSWPAQEIVKSYNQLPAEHRPFDNVYDMVHALDILYGRTSAAQHFQLHFSDQHSWDFHRCSSHSALCSSYSDLHKSIEGIRYALAEREHKLQVAGIQSDLDNIQFLTARLREERDIITSVTKELT